MTAVRLVARTLLILAAPLFVAVGVGAALALGLVGAWVVARQFAGAWLDLWREA